MVSFREIHRIKNSQILGYKTKMDLNSKTISRLGVGGGFREAWSERSIYRLQEMSPKSLQKLANLDKMGFDSLMTRKNALFDVHTMSLFNQQEL